MIDHSISVTEWDEFFRSRGWRAFKQEIQQQVDALSTTLDTEEIPMKFWKAQAEKDRLKYLIEVLPERLQKDEGEIRDERGENGDRGAVRHIPRHRPGVTD